MSDTTTAVRVVNGVDLPVAGSWKVDPGHAEIGFTGRHFMLTKVRGRFTDVDATIEIAEAPEHSRVTAVIDMASVETGSKERDDHLRSADFFDVENHPRATFTSTSLLWKGTSGKLAGDLTIKNVVRRVTLDVDYLGYARDPWDNDRTVFSARGKINREDWGLTWNMALESGGILVSKEIELTLDFEAIRQV